MRDKASKINYTSLGHKNADSFVRVSHTSPGSGGLIQDEDERTRERVVECSWASLGLGERRWHKRERLLPRLESLKDLAKRLNQGAESEALVRILPHRRATVTAENKAWAVARNIVEEVLQAGNAHRVLIPHRAAALFNTLALHARAIFYIAGEPGWEEPLTEAMGRGGMLQIRQWTVSGVQGLKNHGGLIFFHPAGHVVQLLWDFFKHPARDRLKRCPRCHHWFVDCTRNKAAKRCSRSCTWKWWDRPRRKRAGYYKSEEIRRRPRGR